jgi:hypothetical protein
MPMQLHVVRAERNFGVHNTARDKLLERPLRSFRPDLQPAVRRLARRHSRLADLAVSFPALLVALAAPSAGFNREHVIALVIDGAPLAEVAKAADVALWLRRFTPPMLPGTIPKLPDSHDFRRRITNHLPQTPKLAPVWLNAVANAAAWCDETFAIWVARNVRQDPEHNAIYRLQLISLWAWFSARPDTVAHRFVATPWTPYMQFDAALDAANTWRAGAELYADLGDKAIADAWLQPAIVDGYEFVPLRTVAELTEEGRVMRNCVQTYGYKLTHNCSRLWSIRKDGHRIATLELARFGGDPLLAVSALRSPANGDAPVAVAWAVRRWLYMQDLAHGNANATEWDDASFNRAAWIALWKPYWLAKRRFPQWLPLAPSRLAIDAL